MPESPPASLLPPRGEVNVLPARVVRVAGGNAALTGLSWNSEGHIALSFAGDGVRLVADASELAALARLLEAIAAELVQRDGGEQAVVPELPPAGEGLQVTLQDSFLETISQTTGSPMSGVTITRPDALAFVVAGKGVRLVIRDRGDVAQLHRALDVIDAHLAGVAGAADAALARLAGAEAAGNA